MNEKREQLKRNNYRLIHEAECGRWERKKGKETLNGMKRDVI
jgi:hypothetical protein